MQDPIESTQWQRLGELFDKAIGMDAAQQSELVRTIERDDAGCAKALATLLAADARHRATTADHRERLLERSIEAIETLGVTVGDRVGPFVLREKLGHGGMGVVFRAERADAPAHGDVAIKILRRSLIAASGQERFAREREIVARFRHPCIARLLEAGQTDDGSPWLAMELVRGPTITGHCYALRLDTRRRIEVFLDVCEAVRHAHESGILHRDLKPDNVLIGEDGLPRLIDFGIAKSFARASEGAQTHTTTTRRFFSPGNVAPEQLRGERVDVACDVYQLGTLLHELLCGSEVFETQGLTPRQLEERICEAIPEPPSGRAARVSAATARSHGKASPAALARELRGEIDAIVEKALRKAPEERYASVPELAADLRNYLQGKPVAALDGRFGYRMRKYLRRRALSLVAWSVVIVVVTGLVTALWVQGQEIARVRHPATGPAHVAAPPR